MDILFSGMTLTVPKGTWRYGEKEISVTGGEFKIDPPTIISVENEIAEISDEKPKMWDGGTRFKELISDVSLHDCMVPNSIIVKSIDGSTVYKEGVDYFADHVWAGISRMEGGKMKKGEKILVSYKYSLERIDLLEYGTDELVYLKKGKEGKTCPIPPVSDSDRAALANIFVPYHTTKITLDLIYPIGPLFPKPSKAELIKKSKIVAKTLDKLKKGKEVNVVCWGDSVTNGGDTSTPDKAFRNVFVKMLKDKFLNPKITIQNAGIGGTSSDDRLPGLQKDVLDFSPDLVTIEFVNDMGMTEEHFKKNYHLAIDQIKGRGAEVILITPHFTMPSMMGHKNMKEARETRTAVKWLRDLAADKGVGLADASVRWEHLSAEGLPYITLLSNGINHPDDRGHLMFAEELMKYFQG